MLSIFLRHSCVALCAWLIGPGQAYAQAPALGLHQAFEAAWAISPQARALNSRQAELQAREQSAQTFFAGPPALSLSRMQGRLPTGQLWENEAEISAPVWNPGARAATLAHVYAERDVLQARMLAERLLLAGELRELAAQLDLAKNDLALAQRRAQEAVQLAQDTARRVKVGDVARVDLMEAQAIQHQLASDVQKAQMTLQRTLAQWHTRTGMAEPATLDEAEASFQELTLRPPLLLAQATLQAARATLAVTQADSREPMEIGAGVRRESDAGATQNAIRLSLRVPLGSSSRNVARLAAAQAQVDEAQAQYDVAHRMAVAEEQAARAAWSAASHILTAAREREALAQQAHALIVKAHQLGEKDLPARLRADAARYEAELALKRAETESRLALSRLNQSFGVLP